MADVSSIQARAQARERTMAPVRRHWFGAEGRTGMSGWTKAGLGLAAVALAGGGKLAYNNWSQRNISNDDVAVVKKKNIMPLHIVTRSSDDATMEFTELVSGVWSHKPIKDYVNLQNGTIQFPSDALVEVLPVMNGSRILIREVSHEKFIEEVNAHFERLQPMKDQSVMDDVPPGRRLQWSRNYILYTRIKKLRDRIAAGN